jgi:hypothetical protein
MTPAQSLANTLHKRYPQVFPAPVDTSDIDSDPELIADEIEEEQLPLMVERPKFRMHKDGDLAHGAVNKVTYRLMKSKVADTWFPYVEDSKGWRLIRMGDDNVVAGCDYETAIDYCIDHSAGRTNTAGERKYTNYHGLEEKLKDL